MQTFSEVLPVVLTSEFILVITDTFTYVEGCPSWAFDDATWQEASRLCEGTTSIRRDRGVFVTVLTA